MAILMFGGTIEGRLLAQWLSEERIPAHLCVATEYGEALAEHIPGVTVHTGRLDQPGMEALMARDISRVIDATHPYAAQVSALIAAAAEASGVPYTRLIREEGGGGDWLQAADAPEAARLAEGLLGNVLLTTGSKDLDAFARPGLLERCYPRVLPSPASLARCLDLGYPASQVICMQGPFSQALNEAMIAQCRIGVLVTKATGAAGGFWDKVRAARSGGCALVVIRRPGHETGLDLDAVKAQIEGERT